MLKSMLNRGFHLSFENGWTVSVQWGTGNYCARRDYSAKIDSDCAAPMVESPDAEIAVWRGKMDMVQIGNDSVAGYVTADNVARVIALVQGLREDETARNVTARLENILF